GRVLRSGNPSARAQAPSTRGRAADRATPVGRPGHPGDAPAMTGAPAAISLPAYRSIESGASGGRAMQTRKLIAAVALGALVGSDLALAVSPALGQAPGPGNGQPLMPSLGGGDGTYGRVLPGPSMTAPYAAPQQPPLAL